MHSQFVVRLISKVSVMKKIVLLRHGESTWNKENRFTGWTDVDLSDHGVREAVNAGKLMRDNGLDFSIAYTSLLKRAIKTLNISLDSMGLDWIPVVKAWQLNEKHYGVLQGLNKTETANRFGAEQVFLWRRSYDVAPDPLSDSDSRNPRFDARYKDIPDNMLPRTESLEDTVNRVLPYWEGTIMPSLKEHDGILVSAHGNSLRAIIKVLKNISDQDIVNLNLPTAVPYVLEFNDSGQLYRDYFLGDADEIQRLMNKVANQATV